MFSYPFFIFVFYVFLLAFTISFLMVPPLMRLAWRFNVIDLPNHRKIHKEPTPLLGGIAIFGAFTMVLSSHLFFVVFFQDMIANSAFFSPRLQFYARNTTFITKEVLAVILGGAVIAFVGVIDDIKGLSKITRLVIETIVASVLVCVGFKLAIPLPAYITWTITVLWIVGITNAFNLLDGADGLAGGVGIISSLILAGVMFFGNQPLIGLLLLTLAASIGGFLRYNISPARIFMGSSGSMFIGYILSITTILATFTISSASTSYVLALPVVILGIPIYDTFSVIFLRIIKKVSIARGDLNHLVHRLLRAGFTQRKAVLLIYLMAFETGVLGIFLIWTTDIQSIMLLCFIASLFVGIFFFEWKLAKRNPEYQGLKNAAGILTRIGKGRGIKSWAKQALRHWSFDAVIVGFVLFLLCAHPLALDLRLVKPFSLCKLVIFYGTCIFVIACWLLKFAYTCFVHRRLPQRLPGDVPEPPPSPNKNLPERLTACPTIPALPRGACFHHTPLTYPVFAYLAAVLFSAIFSLNKTTSLFGYYAHYEGLLTTLGYVAVFFAILTYFKKQHVFSIIFAVSFAGFFASVYGVIQFWGFDPVQWKDVGERLKIVSTFGNPVFFSGYIVSVFPVALAGFLLQLKKRSLNNALRANCLAAFFAVVLLLMLFNLFVTETRGAWAGFILGMVCFTILFFLDFVIRHRNRFFVTAAILAIIAGTLIGYKYKRQICQAVCLAVQKGDISASFKGNEANSPVIRYLKDVRSGQSILCRIVQYRSSLDMFCDHPITGIGPDVVGGIFPRYAFNHYKEAPGLPPFENVLGIHNDVLDKAVTTGIVGLGSYLWIIVTFIILVKRYFKRRLFGNVLASDDRLVLAGLLACLVGYLTQQQFNVVECALTVHFWVFLAAGAVLANAGGESSKCLSRQTDTEKQPPSQMPCRKTSWRVLPSTLFCFSSLIVGGGVAYGLYYLSNIYRADLCHKKGSELLSYATTIPDTNLNYNFSWRRGLAYYGDSIFYNSRQAFYRYRLCDAYLFMLRRDLNNVTLIQEIIKESEKIVELDPNEDLAFNYLANAYDLLEYNTKTDYGNKIVAYCERAIAINPYKHAYYDCLGAYYAKKGSFDKAIPMYQQIFRMKPDYPGIDKKLTNAYLPLIEDRISKGQVLEAESLLTEIQAMPHAEDTYLKKLKVMIFIKKEKREIRE